MSIVIFVLKLLEVFWNVILSNNYWTVTDKDCIIYGIFSIILLVPFVYIIVKRMKNKKAFIEIFSILTGFMIIWIFIFLSAIFGSYPLCINITIFIVTVSNLTIWGLCLSKWSVIKIINN